MKKSIYEEAKMEVIRFDNEDIITDSTEEGSEIGGGGTSTGGGVGYDPSEEG